jgi:hypothetical protein
MPHRGNIAQDGQGMRTMCQFIRRSDLYTVQKNGLAEQKPNFCCQKGQTQKNKSTTEKQS